MERHSTNVEQEMVFQADGQLQITRGLYLTNEVFIDGIGAQRSGLCNSPI